MIRISVLLLMMSILLACNPSKERLRYRIERKYESSVFPSDTSFIGKVLDIKPTRFKKPGDIATIKSNNVYIISNQVTFLITITNPCFIKNDSVKVEVKRVKFRFELNDVKVTIFPKFGTQCETYGIVNLTEKEKMDNELKQLN